MQPNLLMNDKPHGIMVENSEHMMNFVERIKMMDIVGRIRMLDVVRGFGVSFGTWLMIYICC